MQKYKKATNLPGEQLEDIQIGHNGEYNDKQK